MNNFPLPGLIIETDYHKASLILFSVVDYRLRRIKRRTTIHDGNAICDEQCVGWAEGKIANNESALLGVCMSSNKAHD